MQIIPNTGFPEQDRLMASHKETKVLFDEFEQWYKEMAGLRGGVLPKMPLEDPHIARCVMYLGKRHRVANALPAIRAAILQLEETLEKTIHPDTPCMVLDDLLQMMQVNYLLVKAFVVKAKALIAKAEDHISRSKSVDYHIERALTEALRREEGDPFFQELDKLIR